jgi:hypothetical protein
MASSPPPSCPPSDNHAGVVPGTTALPLEGGSSTDAEPSSDQTSTLACVEGEETLESHEVIELQAFIERKTWIEDKIKVTYYITPHYELLRFSLASGSNASRRSVRWAGRSGNVS